MSKIPAIQTLCQKGLIDKGTVLGVAETPGSRVYHRFVVAHTIGAPDVQITGVHIQNNTSLVLDINKIVEVDGMGLERYLQHADLDNNGSQINRGKKRGRRPKHRK